MRLHEIRALHDRHIAPGMGTTTPGELDYIQHLIRYFRPRRFLEVGTGSGLSTGFIAHFLEAHGGASMTTLDTSRRFFSDPGKPVGYLASEVYRGDAVRIAVHPGRTALDLGELGGPWEMAFVDADHCHPWPTLDTLALWPHLDGAKTVIHHDLKLYRRHRKFRGVGPKLLYDQFPEDRRNMAKANFGNIFSLNLDMGAGRLEHIATDALSLPWTLAARPDRAILAGIRRMLAAHYSPALGAVFEECIDTFAPPPRSAMRRLAAPLARLRHRWR